MAARQGLSLAFLKVGCGGVHRSCCSASPVDWLSQGSSKQKACSVVGCDVVAASGRKEVGELALH